MKRLEIFLLLSVCPWQGRYPFMHKGGETLLEPGLLTKYEGQLTITENRLVKTHD